MDNSVDNNLVHGHLKQYPPISNSKTILWEKICQFFNISNQPISHCENGVCNMLCIRLWNYSQVLFGSLSYFNFILHGQIVSIGTHSEAMPGG